ncbi:MAG: hypothetical protein K0S68_552 [Candidatus Saccharibacteria bacterium]|nr:hypothetical protein [Candidatus Saccharibacteria bacterium]
MAWPKWRHTLNESKRLAIKAVDEYNLSNGHYADFIGPMVRAWLYLLQAEFQRDKVDHRHHTDNGDLVFINGAPKLWEVGQCVKHRFPAPNDPVRINLELFILLRNKVEHRYERALKEVAGGRAHALVINFEQHLTTVFGPEHSLAHLLRFPLFVESITSPDKQPTLAGTRASRAARTMLSRFDSNIDDSVLDDNRYDFRVRLIPTTSSKMTADAAYDFVNLEHVSDEERAILVGAGRAGKVITKVKSVPVAAKGTMLPKAIVAAVQKRVPYEFNYAIHTRMWKHFKLHPARWQPPEGGPTVEKYCFPVEPTKSYVYTAAWVDKIVREIGTAEKFEAFFGHPPKKGKVTQIDAARAGRQSAETAAPVEHEVS